MHPATPEQRALRTLYCNLMDEIKHRIFLMGELLDGTFKIPDLPTFEFCHLQLRMICELIALGSLAVHNDIGRTVKLKGSSKADMIIKAMAKLHPRFYPEPGLPVKHPDGHEEFIRLTCP